MLRFTMFSFLCSHICSSFHMPVLPDNFRKCYLSSFVDLSLLIVSRACSMSRATYLLSIVSVWLVVCLLACLLVDSYKISSDFEYLHSF